MAEIIEKIGEAFEKWLCDTGIQNITPRDGHARRAFEAGANYATQALATELSALRAEVVLFAERIKREVGLGCPDPWRTSLIARIDAEAQAFTALQQQEDKQDGR